MVILMQRSPPGEVESGKARLVRGAALCEGDDSISAEIDGQRFRASLSIHTHGNQQANRHLPLYSAAWYECLCMAAWGSRPLLRQRTNF